MFRPFRAKIESNRLPGASPRAGLRQAVGAVGLLHILNEKIHVRFQLLSLLILVTAALCLFQFPGYATENATPPITLVKEALAAMEKSKVSRWAYTMTSTVDGKKTVEQYDPSASRSQRWKLVSKDGKAPTDAERREYAKKRKRDSGTGQFNLKELVDLASVKVEKDDADRLTCSLRMKGDGDEGRMIAEKVHGKLIVRKQTPVIESLELANTERIGKRGVFSLSEFKIRMQFAFDQTVGEHLPVSFSMRLRGRALLVKSLNSDTEVTFGNFRRPEKVPADPTKAD